MYTAYILMAIFSFQLSLHENTTSNYYYPNDILLLLCFVADINLFPIIIKYFLSACACLLFKDLFAQVKTQRQFILFGSISNFLFSCNRFFIFLLLLFAFFEVYPNRIDSPLVFWNVCSHVWKKRQKHNIYI